VCVPLGIFVCTRCSGILYVSSRRMRGVLASNGRGVGVKREWVSRAYVFRRLTEKTKTLCERRRDFNFRIKSISASTFTSEEVEILRRKGNDEARRTYLAAWDPSYPLPTCGDVVRCKAFIKQVFAEKKYHNDQGAPAAVSTARPTAVPALATTSAPDLFGGLFDSPTPSAAPQQQQHAPPPAFGGSDWSSFDAPPQTAAPPVQFNIPPPASAPATVTTTGGFFAPPPAPAHSAYAARAPVAQPGTAPPTQQADLFGGLTIETPVKETPAVEQAAPVGPTTRAPLEEDFWTITPPPPQAPPPQAHAHMPQQMQMPQQTHMPQQMQMPQQTHMPQQMQMPQQTHMPQQMQMPGMQMPGMQMPQHMQMPGMQMPQQMQMPGMQMPGMQMPGMQMPGMAVPQQPPQQVVEQAPVPPDPFESFGALTGIKPVVPSQQPPQPAPAMPQPVQAAPVPVVSQPFAPEPAVPQPPLAPEQKTVAPPAPTPAVNLGPMGFPMPASQPPSMAPAVDYHQAIMFEDMKVHAAGDSFAFAPVDSPPPSAAAVQLNPATGMPMPPAPAPAPVAPTQYSQDNPFAFI